MREPGAILFISCYELGHPPLGIASPLGFLARAGYPATGLDVSVQSLDPEAVARARFIGIATPMHTALRLGMRVLARVREINPSAHVCVYGLYASLNAAHLFDHGADSVIGGECEQPLLDLIRALEAGGDAPAGVSTRDHHARPVLRRTDFALPQRESLPPLNRYAQLEWTGERRLAGYVEASRGCAHQCLHCPITPVYEGRFFVVAREVVMADIDAQVERGASHVTFGDPDFLNGPTHALKLVRELHRRHPGITFDFTTKVEHILQHRAHFPELREQGCLFVVSAVESFSDLVLARLEKGHTAADIFEALAILDEARIWMRPSFVAFTPWTTREDYRRMLDLVEQHGLIDQIDPVQYSIRLFVPPGSALLWRAETRTWLGELDPAAFAYRWRHPDPGMDALHAAVAARVEAAARCSEAPSETFAAIRGLAGANPSPGLSPTRGQVERVRPAPGRPPRLTESWFC